MMEKPKRPMSAYMLWLNSTRAQIKAEHPGLKVTEVAKRAGELWRAMDDKSLWQERAELAKQQYSRDLEAYDFAAPPDTAAKRTNKRSNHATKPKKEKPTEKEASDEADADSE